MGIKEGLFQRIRAISAGSIYVAIRKDGENEARIARVKRSDMTVSAESEPLSGTENDENTSVRSIAYGNNSVYALVSNEDAGSSSPLRYTIVRYSADLSELLATATAVREQLVGHDYLVVGYDGNLYASSLLNDDEVWYDIAAKYDGQNLSLLGEWQLTPKTGAVGESGVEARSLTHTPDGLYITGLELSDDGGGFSGTVWWLHVFRVDPDTMTTLARWTLDEDGDFDNEPGVLRPAREGGFPEADRMGHDMAGGIFVSMTNIHESFEDAGGIDERELDGPLFRVSSQTMAMTHPRYDGVNIFAVESGADRIIARNDDEGFRMEAIDPSDLTLIEVLSDTNTGGVESVGDGFTYTALVKYALPDFTTEASGDYNEQGLSVEMFTFDQSVEQRFPFEPDDPS